MIDRSLERLFILRQVEHLASCFAFLREHWAIFAAEGEFLAVTVKVFKSKRSLEQNRRYWGPAVLGAIEEQARGEDGQVYEKWVWHEYFKRKFIGVVELPNGGIVGMSSTQLEVEQFSTFMQEVEAYAATELGVVFPDATPY